MAHNANCSNAKSPPRDCECSCGGALHGGGSQTLGPGPWGRDVHYSHYGRQSRLAPSLDGLTVRFFDALFRFNEERLDENSALFKSSPDGKLLDTTSDLIADDIADFLGKRRSKPFRKKRRKDHTICSLMVAMVKAMNEISGVLPEAFGDAVEERVRRMGDAKWGLNAEDAGKVAKIVARRAQDAATGGTLPLYIESCRRIAIVSCPDMAEHPEVEQYCARPLGEELISDELRQMLENWNRIDGARGA
jgi:hypothetical protein